MSFSEIEGSFERVIELVKAATQSKISQSTISSRAETGSQHLLQREGPTIGES
jgi:hypothetical protein